MLKSQFQHFLSWIDQLIGVGGVYFWEFLSTDWSLCMVNSVHSGEPKVVALSKSYLNTLISNQSVHWAVPFPTGEMVNYGCYYSSSFFWDGSIVLFALCFLFLAIPPISQIELIF